MKFIHAFTLVALNLLTINLLAQKDEIQLGSHFLASEATEIHLGGSFAYFQARNTHHLLGAKLSFGTDALELEATDLKHYTLSMDFLNRWTTTGGQGRCYAELGLSAMGEADRLKPGAYFIECATGMTPEQLREASRLYREGISDNRFYLGVTAGVGLEARLGPRLLLGANASSHFYRMEQSLRAFIRPGLVLTRQF
jgi:hypothetical protein